MVSSLEQEQVQVQVQVPSEIFIEALEGSHGISESIIDLIKIIKDKNGLLFDSEFVRQDPSFIVPKFMEDGEGESGDSGKGEEKMNLQRNQQQQQQQLEEKRLRIQKQVEEARKAQALKKGGSL